MEDIRLELVDFELAILLKDKGYPQNQTWDYFFPDGKTNTDKHYKQFLFKEDIVWIKPDGAAKLRCGGWVQNSGRPTTWHPNINTEYLMVYKKPGERNKSGPFSPIKNYYPKIPKDLLTCTWYINPETNKHYHDAPFPEEIAKRCILLYSFEGETVLDPFAGTFTVSRVARDLGRNSIGMELSSEYIKHGKEEMGFYQKPLFGTVTYEEV